MPTLTFYVTDEVAHQLDELVDFQTREQDRKVSRGDVLTPVIKRLHRKTITPIHQTQNKTTLVMTGDISGISSGK